MTHPTGNGADQLAILLAELARRGAPADCHVMSKSSIHDGKVMQLTEALSDDGGALVICLPGQLAVHLPEAPEAPEAPVIRHR